MAFFRQPDGRQVFIDVQDEIGQLRKEIHAARCEEKTRKTAFIADLGVLLKKVKEDTKKDGEGEFYLQFYNDVLFPMQMTF